jgi:ABC-type multidrug transport system permease subunit
MLKKQSQDNLTKSEVRAYMLLCYISVIGFFVCGYFITTVQVEEWKNIILVVSFIFLGIGMVFSFAIKHDARVLDLRSSRKKK